MKRLVWLVVLLAAGCGVDEGPAPVQGEVADPRGGQGTPVLARVLVVDGDNAPVSGMLPIASKQPNAFDPPLALGSPTGADGRGALSLAGEEVVYVRAWDPSLQRFANNFYEVYPGAGAETELMRIVMVEGASLEAVLEGPSGVAAAEVTVDLMLYHPTRGAWWPARAVTSASGKVVFPLVPAGTYTARLEAGGLGRIEVPDVTLPPGGNTSLGALRLLR